MTRVLPRNNDACPASSGDNESLRSGRGSYEVSGRAHCQQCSHCMHAVSTADQVDQNKKVVYYTKKKGHKQASKKISNEIKRM